MQNVSAKTNKIVQQFNWKSERGILTQFANKPGKIHGHPVACTMYSNNKGWCKKIVWNDVG